ncbi:MAG TPA: HAMP domain-containing sensor histidine kinase [Candidatus Kapabacteria bacterium]|nr:HAMP domain-containing sensor histidine kinase [Candidatus Kapabacteria bacterium]
MFVPDENTLTFRPAFFRMHGAKVDFQKKENKYVLLEQAMFSGKKFLSDNQNKERGIRLTILTGFALVIMLSLFIAAWSFYHITSLGNSAENLFLANYRSIQYVHSMEGVLDSYKDMLVGVTQSQTQVTSLNKAFRDNLSLEFHNITEIGESETAHDVEKSYNILYAALTQWIINPSLFPNKEDILGDLEAVKLNCESLLLVNEKAMFQRADTAKDDAAFARTSTLLIICLLIGASIILAFSVSRRSLAEFRQLDRAKSNFVSTAAHELKNPLSSIKTSAGLLLDMIPGEINSKQESLLSNIKQESERLLGTVKDLLDLAKLEAGSLQIIKTPTSISTFVESSLLPVIHQADKAGIHIDVQIAPNISEINIDANKLSWALTNLVSNAIRYSPQGGQVLVSANEIDHEIWVSVKDEGKGIPPKDLENIFEKFVQVEEGAFGGGIGTGLGLSIAKEIVQLHKGKIWADSELGKGSIFTFTIPKNL